MSPKQKRALAALILAALVGGLAAFAPGVSCDVDEAVIEDLIPDEPKSSGPPAQDGPRAESSDDGSSGSESSDSSTDGAGSSSGG